MLSIYLLRCKRAVLTVMTAVIACLSAGAHTYEYSFHDTPLSEAIVRISKDHPEITVSFIYKELDNYTTSAVVATDNAHEALKLVVGRNPVSLIRKGDEFYIEALQHGRFVYTGRAVGSDDEPVAAATVMLLEPKDSTVLTYGVADSQGRFAIPCDHRDVIAKLSCIGYHTVFRPCSGFNIGTVVMPVNATQLESVKVEGQMATAYPDRTVYIPTARQKNASQTGADLIDHMGIPQLRVSKGGNIETNSGCKVVVFIDYIPASENDLKAMRMSDVRRVEYYEYPSDPRLQGNPFVVNFIMQQYEYGGYVKGFDHTNLLDYSGQLLGNIRLQYKEMTYDVMGYGFGHSSKHYGSELTETYRLPQPDGEMRTFDRYSKTTSSKETRRQYFAAAKATYNTERIQAATEIDMSVDRRPHSDRSGIVRYDPAAFPSADYTSTLFSRSSFVSYSGYYYFSLPKDNTLTLTPQYVYSHTVQNSSYAEQGYARIDNDASDNTSQFIAHLKYTHDFGKAGRILSFVRGIYEYNRTRYTGSVVSLDRAKTSRVGVGVNYSVTLGQFYGMTGFGWDWDRLQFGDITDRPSSPWFDLSLQYSPGKKHSVSMVFHYSTWAPDPSFKSENIISANHLLSYTGNPGLVPSKSYDLGVFYSWFPSNDYSLSAFVTTWMVGDRYVYDYEASPTGILRTIKQPLGGYSPTRYGLSGTLRFFDRSLVLTGQISHSLTHNGAPYNFNRSHIDWYARIRYYLGNWNFAATYISPSGKSDDKINGIWTNSKSDWYVTVGWANADWNVRANIINISRWNWRGDRQTMRSRYYDTTQLVYGGGSHALIQLSATYTFGFGRKVSRDNEPSVSGSASSGILK